MNINSLYFAKPIEVEGRVGSALADAIDQAAYLSKQTVQTVNLKFNDRVFVLTPRTTYQEMNDMMKDCYQ